MKWKLLEIVALLSVVVLGGAPGTLRAQECDRCALASYLQSGMSPTARRQFAFQLDYQYRHDTYEGNSEADDAPDEKVANTVFNFFYSQPLFDHLALDFNLPVVSTAYTLRPNNTYESSRESGLGDASILLDVIPVRGKGGGSDAEWRIRGGVKLPTGDSDDLDEFEAQRDTDFGGSAVYPYDLARGTGSFDFILGSSLFLKQDRLIGIGDVQYTARTEGENDFTFGDKVVLQAAPGYLFAVKGASSLGLLVNTMFEYTGEAEQDGETVENTGQTSLAAGPQGLFTIQDTFSASVGVNFPLYRDVDGRQLTKAYEVLASLSASF